MTAIEVITILIFLAAYILMVHFYKRKVWVVWGAVTLLFIFGAITLESAITSIRWDVLGIYIGMMFIAEALMASNLPDYLAAYVANKTRSAIWTMLLVCIMSGFLSVFLENVAVVLIMAPIVFSISQKLDMSPVPLMIGTAISSNLQGVAMYIGDPPSMLLASFLKMDFNDFFMFQGKPALFFAVQLGMLASLAVLYFIFRKYSWRVIEELRKSKIKSHIPMAILLGLVIALMYVSINGMQHVLPLGGVTMFFGAIALFWLTKEKHRYRKKIVNTIFELDWNTAFFIIAIFIVVQSLVDTGVMRDIALLAVSLIGTSMALAFLVVVVFSILISAFVDNVPYIVAMLPLIQQMGNELQVTPYVLYFGLLIGASVGGNITPIGATANIAAVGLLKARGHETTFWQFVKIGLPFTIVSVAVSAGFIWLVFG
ncbi:SLC13 family permease [Nanoarchaeota archaeon]